VIIVMREAGIADKFFSYYRGMCIEKKKAAEGGPKKTILHLI